MREIPKESPNDETKKSTDEHVSELHATFDEQKLKSPETSETTPLFQITKTLKLIEAPEMLELKVRVIKSIKNNDDPIDGYIEYEDNVRKILDQYEGDDRDKADVAAIISKATMFKEAGNNERYKEEIADLAFFGSLQFTAAVISYFV